MRLRIAETYFLDSRLRGNDVCVFRDGLFFSSVIAGRDPAIHANPFSPCPAVGLLKSLRYGLPGLAGQ